MSVRLICVLSILVAAGGCSFDRRWLKMNEQARAVRPASPFFAPATAPTEPLAGRWEGKWISEQDGHSGRLRAIVDRVDNDTYHIEYDGWFFGLLRFVHGMNVKATRDPNSNTVHFEGEEDLGSMAGGVYRYNGTADGRTFTSTYQSKDDHGRFEMKRPQQ